VREIRERVAALSRQPTHLAICPLHFPPSRLCLIVDPCRGVGQPHARRGLRALQRPLRLAVDAGLHIEVAIEIRLAPAPAQLVRLGDSPPSVNRDQRPGDRSRRVRQQKSDNFSNVISRHPARAVCVRHRFAIVGRIDCQSEQHEVTRCNLRCTDTEELH
jgi:hypothetical protein